MGKGRVTVTPMRERGQDQAGRWYWRLRHPDPKTGRRVSKGLGRLTYQEAEEVRADVEARLRLGLQPSPDSARPSTVQEVGEAYLDELERRLGADHPYLREETKRMTNVLRHLGPLRADRVTESSLKAYAQARRRDPSRRRRKAKPGEGPPPPPPVSPAARSSILEELACLRRAYTTARDLGEIDCSPPPRPALKAIPDDSRPARRLTEGELARLLTAAVAEDVVSAPGPRPGTVSRAVWEYVAAHPGCPTAQISALPGRHTAIIARTMQARGVLRRDEAGGWFVVEDDRPSLGLVTLLQVLAWSGRRPIAVFGVRRRDCERIVDQELDRKDRLMYWERDKGGVNRGWGPVAEPALEALVARCAEVHDPDALLWTTPTGLEWTPERISRIFARCVQRAGLRDVEPYDLRRFAVTQILNACRGQFKVAQVYTGHKTVQSLLRYAYAPQGAAEDLAGRIGWTREPLQLVHGVEDEG